MADDCRRAYSKYTTSSSDTPTIHSHVHNTLVNIRFIGFVYEIELKVKAPVAIATDVTLGSGRYFTVFQYAICGVAMDAGNFYDCHKKAGRLPATAPRNQRI